MGTEQRPCRAPGNGHLAPAWCQAALPAPDTTGLVACLSPAALGHGVRWAGSDWWMGRQGPPRPKLITSLLDISIPSLPYAWMAGMLSPWGKKITHPFGKSPRAYPSSLLLQSQPPFWRFQSFQSRALVISSSHFYARKRLIGIREPFHPPRAQVPLSGESESEGQAA